MGSSSLFFTFFKKTSTPLALVLSTASVLLHLENSLCSAEESFALDSALEFARHSFLSPEARGRGNTGVADRGGLDLTLLNPAVLRLSEDIEVFVSACEKNPLLVLVEFETLDGTSSISVEQKKLPFSFGIGSGLSDYVYFGMLYSRQNEVFFDLGEAVMTDAQGEVIGLVNEYNSYSSEILSFPVSVQIFDRIALGAELQIIDHQIKMKMLNDMDEESFWTYNMKFGSVIDLHRNLSIGLSLLPQMKRKFTLQLEGEGHFATIPFDHEFPLELLFGFKYKAPGRPLTLLGDVLFRRTSVDPYLDDQWDVRIGGEYDFNNTIRLRAGILTLQDIRDFEVMPSYAEFGVVYLTLGAGLSFEHFSCDVSMITNRLTPVGDYKNTSFGIGLNVPLSITHR
jgi:hypothetical protein